AVQGGLLAATVAQQANRLQGSDARARHYVKPAVQFVSAKIVAYTLLGALLGWAGRLVTPRFQGTLQVIVGVFMVLMVLQLFDVHPALRYLTPRPPKFAQRFIRQRSKDGSAWTPFILGGLTVLIPCSVTMAIEGLAIASHDVTRGALIMAAFTLGTAPLFLGLATAGSMLGKANYRAFKPLAAVVVAGIGLLSIVSGARLMGWTGGLPGRAAGPATIANVDPPVVAGDGGGAAAPSFQEATVYARGTYEPARIQVKAGVPTHLKLVAEGARGCIRSFTVPAYNLQAQLPENGETSLDLPAAAPGEIVFTCSMGMYSGVIEVLQ
ncbi:MAG: sulfite exporter TauE/SafE family protein, partial [Ardenticatenales bacterium]